MRRSIVWVAVLALGGCEDCKVQELPVDASIVQDAPPPDEAPPVNPPGGFSQTAGGGAAESASYRVRLSIGAPQPMGTGSSASFRVQLGPRTK